MREMLEEVIRKFNAKVASDPTLQADLGDVPKTILIELKDGAKYHFTVKDQKIADLIDGGVDHADITLTTDAETLRGLIRREIGPFKAYATGKVKLKGSFEDISRIRKFF
ncbi:MAG: SCP2 sterol-binding domain-containing protein [Methanobacteriota archaeon]|nr:MAG: SCP2 sterol-binding domain-containing protein [Euryarchaeota archaeon]